MSLYAYLMAGPAVLALGSAAVRDRAVRRTGLVLALVGTLSICLVRLTEFAT